MGNEKDTKLILDCLQEYRENSLLAKTYIKHNHQVGCLMEFAQIVLDEFKKQQELKDLKKEPTTDYLQYLRKPRTYIKKQNK